MAAELHPRSGKLIGLSNSNRTARRNQPVQEFNHGLVLSKEPLRDRDVFTVRIDKKVNNPRGFPLAGLRAARMGNSVGGTHRSSVSASLPYPYFTAGDSSCGSCSNYDNIFTNWQLPVREYATYQSLRYSELIAQLAITCLGCPGSQLALLIYRLLVRASFYREYCLVIFHVSAISRCCFCNHLFNGEFPPQLCFKVVRIVGVLKRCDVWHWCSRESKKILNAHRSFLAELHWLILQNLS